MIKIRIQNASIEVRLDTSDLDILETLLCAIQNLADRLDRMETKLNRIYGREMMMTQEVTQLVQDVENLTSVEQANEAAISGAVAIMGQGVSEIQALADQIASSIDSGDTATLQGLSTKLSTVSSAMKANQDALAGASSALSAAVVANTPVAPVAPAVAPATSDNGPGIDPQGGNSTTDTGTQLDPSGSATPGSTTSDTPVGG